MSWNDCVHGGGNRLLFEAMICRQCEAGAASAFRAPLAQIRGARRHGTEVALARAGAIYLAAAGFGLSATAAGRAFGRHRSTVDHACRRIELRRDAEPAFNIAMACLTEALSRRIAGVARDAILCAEGADRGVPPVARFVLPAWEAAPARHPAVAATTRAGREAIGGPDIPARHETAARLELAGGAQ